MRASKNALTLHCLLHHAKTALIFTVVLFATLSPAEPLLVIDENLAGIKEHGVGSTNNLLARPIQHITPTGLTATTSPTLLTTTTTTTKVASSKWTPLTVIIVGIVEGIAAGAALVGTIILVARKVRIERRRAEERARVQRDIARARERVRMLGDDVPPDIAAAIVVPETRAAVPASNNDPTISPSQSQPRTTLGGGAWQWTVWTFRVLNARAPEYRDSSNDGVV